MAQPQAKPRVAVLVHDGYQELEFWYPLLRLREEEIDAVVLGVDADATYVSHLGYPVIPDQAFSTEPAGSFTGVVIPGRGAGETLVASPEAIRFVADAAAAGAAIGVIGGASAVLTAAGVQAGPKVAAAADANALPEFFRQFRGQLA